MNSMMWKTTLREIRHSLGRYLAILAIVALGVGIFAGLKVTKPFMVSTIEGYFEEYQLYDFQLISTYGFEQKDVEYLAAKEGARAVEGSYSYDVLCSVGEDDSVLVLKAHTLLEKINGVEVLAGRLPENPDECIVDADLYGEEMIGQTVRLSSDNEEDTLDVFTEKEFTICGIGNAVTYVQFERGNTSLGSGKIDGFMYVLPETFDSDIYTEVYVKLDQDFPLYSDEYDAFIEENEDRWEIYIEEAAGQRFDRVRGEVQKELDEARREFEEEKAKAEAELADAKLELDDAAKEISSGKQQIADGKQDIQEGYAEIKENEEKLASGQAEIDNNRKVLAEKEKELAAGYAQLEERQKEVDEQLAVVQAGEAELEAAEAPLLAKENEVLSLEQQLAAGQIAEPMRPMIEGLINTYKSEIAAGKAVIAEKRAEIESGYAQIRDAQSQLDEARAELDAGKAQIEAGKKELAQAESDVAAGRQEIESAKGTLKDAENDIAQAEADLAKGQEKYADGLSEYEEGVAEFETEIADAEAEITDAQKEIDDMELPDFYVLGRDTNVGYVCLENDSAIVADIADVLPVFFFLIAALVCMTTMNRMVEEQRTQIGTFKALGYSDRTIMSKFLIYSGSAAGIGCVLGYLLGTVLLSKVIWGAYGMMYISLSLDYYMNWPLALLSFAGSMLASVGVTWISCKTELLNVAATLMRPKSPKAGKRVFLEHIPFVWKRLSFLVKVSVRNVLRYKKRFFMMIVGISGCMGLLVTGFGIKDSINDVTTIQYNEITVYDMSVVFKDEITNSVLEEVNSIVEGEAEQVGVFIEGSMELMVNGAAKSIYYVVPKDEETIGSYVDLHTLDGEPIPFPKTGEAVISHKIAENLGIQVGDKVVLMDEDRNQFGVKISGICQNFVFNYIFFNEGTCVNSWKIPEYQTLYLNMTDSGTDIHEISAQLMQMDEVANVTINQDVEDRFNSMMRSMDLVVLTIILCAAALAFIVLYNLTNINITERVREIATIKVLGFNKKETAAYVFRENIALTAIGAVIGLFLGRIFHIYIMNCINIDMVAFDVRINPESYLFSLVLTFVFTWIVNLFMQSKLDKISMTESLKSVD